MSVQDINKIVKRAREEARIDYNIARQLLNEAADRGLSLEEFSKELQAIKQIHAEAINAVALG